MSAGSLNGDESNSEGQVDRPGTGLKRTDDPDADAWQVWTDIWRDALQAGLASLRQESESRDE